MLLGLVHFIYTCEIYTSYSIFNFVYHSVLYEDYPLLKLMCMTCIL